MICRKNLYPIDGVLQCPDLQQVEKKPDKELAIYKLLKIHYEAGTMGVWSLGMTHSDGKKLGCRLDKCNQTFSDIAKIKKVKCSFKKDEGSIRRL